MEPGSMWTNPPHIHSTTKSMCETSAASSLSPPPRRHPCSFPLFPFPSPLSEPRHSSYDFYPSFPLSFSLALTLSFLLCSPSRPRALRRRAGCRRRTGPWRRRWRGRPRAPWRTTPGRCSWRGASPPPSWSGSNPRPRPSPPGGRSRRRRKDKQHNQQQ